MKQADRQVIWQAFQIAPEDDEPLTEEERKAITIARQEIIDEAIMEWESVQHRQLDTDVQD